MAIDGPRGIVPWPQVLHWVLGSLFSLCAVAQKLLAPRFLSAGGSVAGHAWLGRLTAAAGAVKNDTPAHPNTPAYTHKHRLRMLMSDCGF